MSVKLKSYIKDKAPFLPILKYKVLNYKSNIEKLKLRVKTKEKIFNYIFHKNTWGDRNSVSGPGSNIEQTKVIRNILPIFIEDLRCSSKLDIPCRDYYWMKMVLLNVNYI